MVKPTKIDYSEIVAERGHRMALIENIEKLKSDYVDKCSKCRKCSHVDCSMCYVVMECPCDDCLMRFIVGDLSELLRKAKEN